MKTLLIGAARSGKSSLAQRWASERSQQVCTVVTGIPSDPEMAARIGAHRRERPAHWRVREEPVHLGGALREEAAAGAGVLLIDCLTLWLSNCLWPAPAVPTASEWQPDEALWAHERAALLTSLAACSAEIIVVSNEVGAGIVPLAAAARRYQDEHGRLNQDVAALCEQVFLVIAGLPLRLKPL
ncbi:MAG: bifunctional adenosylcobinamide kinase/adenosylcobinamide-phosphate guanylyltransferase [Sinobacteraceae bacterium]|nr:bifunctional adenosylcobinamide kinase/adenosylcobinamide-phosphate guanylyltransferase [Nevskiaceae bacterium]